jgi:hypothetical protein
VLKLLNRPVFRAARLFMQSVENPNEQIARQRSQEIQHNECSSLMTENHDPIEYQASGERRYLNRDGLTVSIVQ